MGEHASEGLPALVTSQRLDLSIIFPEDRELAIPLLNPETKRRESRDFKVRGRLDIDTMAELVRIETRINDAMPADGEPAKAGVVSDADRAMLATIEQANGVIHRILSESNSDVPERLGLDESQIIVVIAWLAGDISAADAVARAITAGLSGAQTAEQVAEGAEAAGLEPGSVDAAPLVSSQS